MADDSVSAIDDKNNTEDTTSTDTSDWSGFVILVIQMFFLFLLLVLIGSNFIFLVNFNALDIVFPTDIEQYLPDTGKRMKGGNANRTTYARKLSDGSFDLLKYLGYTHKLTGWPYSMYEKNAARFTIQEFLNWFALIEANSFIMYRTLMKKIYGGELIKMLPEPLLYLIAILLPSLLIIPIFFLALGSTAYYSVISEKMGWVYAFFLCWWLILPAIINNLLHQCSLWFNTLITPLLLNYETVFAIAKRNSNWLTMVFGLFILWPAFLTLDSTTSGIMTVAYIIWLIKKIFF